MEITHTERRQSLEYAPSFDIQLTMYATHTCLRHNLFFPWNIHSGKNKHSLLPQYMQLSPSNLIRPILLFTLFQSFTPLLPAMQGRCNHWKGALNLWVLHSPVGYNLVLPSSSLTVFALLSLNSLRPREDMFFTSRYVTDILFISGITNVKW